jgi:hypothetical protein
MYLGGLTALPCVDADIAGGVSAHGSLTGSDEAPTDIAAS